MRIGIIGGGESGIGAAMLALKNGDDPFVSDFNKLDPAYRQELIENNVHFEEGGHTFDILNQCALIVMSPGVSERTPIFKSLQEAGNTIISEIEYGFQYCKGLIIAITGTNGKTTTTNLLHHILESSDIDAVKGGNLGESFCRILTKGEHDFYVLEVSSFQLDNIRKFKPRIALLLNISSDHLDRYSYDINLYADSKIRIASNLTINDSFIYNAEDEKITERIGTIKANLIGLQAIDFDNFSFGLNNPNLRGKHNLMNACFAVKAAELLDVSRDKIQNALNSFVNDDHRLQTIIVLDGIEFINDSKATNVESVYFALDSLPSGIIWIAGGVDKGNDYSILLKLVLKKVRVLICLGSDNSKLISSFEDLPLIILQTNSMNEAVEIAYQHANRGDCVLLSPACASFDLFENYKDRGEQFRNEVFGLLRERK